MKKEYKRVIQTILINLKIVSFFFFVYLLCSAHYLLVYFASSITSIHILYIMFHVYVYRYRWNHTARGQSLRLWHATAEAESSPAQQCVEHNQCGIVAENRLEQIIQVNKIVVYYRKCSAMLLCVCVLWMCFAVCVHQGLKNYLIAI